MNMRNLILCLLLVWSGGCNSASIEADFFNGDIATRNDRLGGYPITQQWKIYLYGNQVIHPPATGLAIVLARQGKPALDYILTSLDSTNNDLDYRDSMVVFQMMEWGNYYRICADESMLSRIKKNQYRIQNPGWRRVYVEMLAELCRSSIKVEIK